jgi:uncharacterized protein YutE (UPF0331/DUF86 family)
MDDVVLNKAEIVERCVARVREVHGGDSKRFLDDPLVQDAIVLNLQRACEASIDLGMHRVRVRQLGIPKESRDAFRLLVDAKLVDRALGERMMRMVGFRNLAVHDYQRIDYRIVDSIVRERLGDFLDFARAALALTKAAE